MHFPFVILEKAARVVVYAYSEENCVFPPFA